jgi:hypothetical protein
MSCRLGRATDFEVLLEQQGTFRCHICSDEPAVLYRARLQQSPTRDATLQDFLDGERFTIRRRLVCARCLRAFVFPNNAICAFATIAGKPWCLRQPPDWQPPVYTREKWFRYVDGARRRRSMV